MYSLEGIQEGVVVPPQYLQFRGICMGCMGFYMDAVYCMYSLEGIQEGVIVPLNTYSLEGFVWDFMWVGISFKKGGSSSMPTRKNHF